MTQDNSSRLAADLDALMNVSTRIEAIQAADPVLAQVEMGEIIRHVAGRHAVLHCNYNELDAVLRLSMGARDIGLDQTWTEMNRLWPQMKTGRLTMAQPLYYAADHGALIVSHAPGRSLFDLARSLAPKEATPALAEAAHWLRRATLDSEEHRAARPGPWLKRAQAASAKQPFADLQGLETEILTILEALAGRISSLEWRVAIIHGDFHPGNLLRSDEHLTGIDFGGSHRLPIYKDMARCLMHLGRRGILPSGQSWMGVDARLADAFVDAFQLGPEERGTILPFFLGVEAILRVERRDLPARRLSRARQMYERLLSDLQRLG